MIVHGARALQTEKESDKAQVFGRGPKNYGACGSDALSCSTLALRPITSIVGRGVYERARMAIQAGHRIGIGVPVLAELWLVSKTAAAGRGTPRKLRRVLPEIIVWPLTEAAAEAYGRLAAQLKRIGRPIGKIDMLIAAIAQSWAAQPWSAPIAT